MCDQTILDLRIAPKRITFTKKCGSIYSRTLSKKKTFFITNLFI